jgi:hypothetical protein
VYDATDPDQLNAKDLGGETAACRSSSPISDIVICLFIPLLYRFFSLLRGVFG